MWRWIMHWTIKSTAFLPWMLLARTKYHFEDRSKQGRKIAGKAVVVSNHTSVYDFVGHMFCFWMRNLRCVVAEVMYNKNKLFTWLLNSLGTIKVDRYSMDFDFVDKCCRVLDKGGVVEIFPESRIPKKDEGMIRFKPSFVLIALRSNAPIVPVYTQGNYFNKKRNHMVVGTPIDARQLYDDSLSEKENLQLISDYVQEKIRNLRDGIEKG
ncbi:MAG: 1-acyl-sn-glycerol-3-phosphate acyltransferase [Clostridia bacterium]|nr:1-acyl-sn-glycerol-3-phosphate acyltransferase [Clostridia bacterium]